MNVPNSLSLFRLLLVPVFVIVFFLGGDNAYIYAALVYVLAEVTDCLDGYIARKFHKITRLGRVLDPLADKLMAFTVLVCIVIESRVPVWAALLFFIKEALMLHQALSLCSSLVDGESRFEAAFFESVRVLVLRLTNTGVGKKISLPEMNARINELLKQSIKSDGVINLFSDIKEEFSLFDPKFLEEVSNMKEKNLAVELLKKLIAEQVSVYRRTNVVKSEKFSEIMQRSLNAYLNGMLTNEEVIEEMLNLAKQIAAAQKEGDQLGLTADELAFYDALTKPQAIKDFYENEELIAITKELADTLRRNKTIDWQKRESARAKMRMLIKKLLKKHKYPPEGMEDAVQTVMTQCELWTDNNDMGEEKVVNFRDKSISYAEANYAPMMVAEGTATYGEKK